MAAPRCWQYAQSGCRTGARNSKRIGDHVYLYCDNPDHEPLTAGEHIARIDERVTEAALDLQLAEDVVWHDVAVAYVQLEVHGDPMKREVARGLGIPADVVVG